MARTTPELVKAVLAPGKDYDTRIGPPLDPFIRVGTRLVDRLVANCALYDVDVPDSDTLTDLETWLAAWAYKNSDQQLATSSAGRSSASFKGQTGMGLESNHYGQVATQLDPTGLLQATTHGVCGGSWTGRRPTEQTDYEQRR